MEAPEPSCPATAQDVHQLLGAGDRRARSVRAADPPDGAGVQQRRGRVHRAGGRVGRGRRLRAQLLPVPRAPVDAPDDPGDGVHDPRPHERVHVAGDRRVHRRRHGLRHLPARAPDVRPGGRARGRPRARVMPYHVFISRQVLLDVPAGLAVLLAFAALYRYDGPETRRWLYLAAALGGIACVLKETMLVFAPAALRVPRVDQDLEANAGARHRRVRRADGRDARAVHQHPVRVLRVRAPAATSSISCSARRTTPPGTSRWSSGSSSRRSRRPRSGTASSCRACGGPRRTSCSCRGSPCSARSSSSGRRSSCRTRSSSCPRWRSSARAAIVHLVALVRARWSTGIAAAAAFVMALAVLGPMIGPAWHAGDVIRDSSFSGPFTTDVEVQDFAGGRETGTWFAEHTPSNAVALTMGPSLGNLVSFYGDRDFFALSVSQDPKLRNPAYRPIPNPDLDIRQIEVQYAVWDAYTADRAPFFSTRLMSYVTKYSGMPVFSVWVNGNNVDYGDGAPPPGVGGADRRVSVGRGRPAVERAAAGGRPVRRALLALVAVGLLGAAWLAPASAQSLPEATSLPHDPAPGRDRGSRTRPSITSSARCRSRTACDVGPGGPAGGWRDGRLRGFSDLGPNAFTVPHGEEVLSNGSTAARQSYDHGEMDGFARRPARRQQESRAVVHRLSTGCEPAVGTPRAAGCGVRPVFLLVAGWVPAQHAEPRRGDGRRPRPRRERRLPEPVAQPHPHDLRRGAEDSRACRGATTSAGSSRSETTRSRAARTPTRTRPRRASSTGRRSCR